MLVSRHALHIRSKTVIWRSLYPDTDLRGLKPRPWDAAGLRSCCEKLRPLRSQADFFIIERHGLAGCWRAYGQSCPVVRQLRDVWDGAKMEDRSRALWYWLYDAQV
jgi:hypothetical protein